MDELINYFRDNDADRIPCILIGVENGYYYQPSSGPIFEQECVDELTTFVNKEFFRHSPLTPVSTWWTGIQGNIEEVAGVVYSHPAFNSSIDAILDSYGLKLHELFLLTDESIAKIPTVRYRQLERQNDWVVKSLFISALGQANEQLETVPFFKTGAAASPRAMRWEFDICIPDAMKAIATALEHRIPPLPPQTREDLHPLDWATRSINDLIPPWPFEPTDVPYSQPDKLDRDRTAYWLRERGKDWSVIAGALKAGGLHVPEPREKTNVNRSYRQPKSNRKSADNTYRRFAVKYSIWIERPLRSDQK